MDIFSTFITLGGGNIPQDRIIDGVDLTSVLFSKKLIQQSIKSGDERSVFFYRGNLLYAVRHGHYKMHLWTWAGPKEEADRVSLIS